MQSALPALPSAPLELRPYVGLGTGDMNNEQTYAAVKLALQIGYRHFDTAANYENEAALGRALRDSSIPRAHVHITTKHMAGCSFGVVGDALK